MKKIKGRIKKKKEKQKLTRKQIIILIIVTIILGILCYFISTEVTKSIIDHRTMEERKKNEDYSDLTDLDTIENIDLNTFINNYNEVSDEDINSSDIVDNIININDTEIDLVINNNYLTIMSINFNKKNKSNKEIISNMIKANNMNIDDDSIDLIYDRVFETTGTTSDKTSETSEFFQYQGLEFSLKEYKDSDYKYSFRIGRITDTEKEE